jgi:hypothetical protein
MQPLSLESGAFASQPG